MRHWLPELSALPNKYVHEPWLMSPAEEELFRVKLGVDYPKPMLPPSIFHSTNHSSSQHQPKKNFKATRGGKVKF